MIKIKAEIQCDKCKQEMSINISKEWWANLQFVLVNIRQFGWITYKHNDLESETFCPECNKLKVGYYEIGTDFKLGG